MGQMETKANKRVTNKYIELSNRGAYTHCRVYCYDKNTTD
jgi:hypothetical protein